MKGPTTRAFIDLVFALVLMLLLVVNPPGAKTDEIRPGNIIVEVRWPDGLATDIDLWVRGPDGESIGYSNKHGEIFNLLRDDLGMAGDPMDLNYEFAFSRGTEPGQYAVNLHYFSGDTGMGPLDVQVAVSIRYESGEVLRVWRGVVPISFKEEKTAIRFLLSRSGRPVPGSLHDTPTSLRGGSR